MGEQRRSAFRFAEIHLSKIIGDGFLFYRLNGQELDLNINCDIKYRMGHDTGAKN
jgi:hypothetical protein